MAPTSKESGHEGHLTGGPRCFVRSFLRAALPLFAVTACGGSPSPSDSPRPARAEPPPRPLEIYRDLGFITGPAQFPAVVGFATFAGPADSTWVQLGLSLPASALRFQRDGAGFLAEYRVELSLTGEDSITAKRHEAREVVRVASFAETGRTDESIVHQQTIAVRPGRYVVRLNAADANSSRGFRATDTLDVPAYDRPALSTPVLVHEAHGRTGREAIPAMIANPRHTVPFGAGAPLVYLEAYDTDDPAVAVRVLNDEHRVAWNGRATLAEGDTELRWGVVQLPPDALPLGRFRIEVDAGGMARVAAPLLMTISEEWLVANAAELIGFLAYIAQPAELDSLRTGSPAEQRAAWDRFWNRRDPMRATPTNEFRDDFFQRVRYATEAFREAGRPGWDTDRGEVYIVLGPPTRVRDRTLDRDDPRERPAAEEWIYEAGPGGELTLTFQDATGSGAYALTPASESAFRSAAERLRSRGVRN